MKSPEAGASLQVFCDNRLSYVSILNCYVKALLLRLDRKIPDNGVGMDTGKGVKA